MNKKIYQLVGKINSKKLVKLRAKVREGTTYYKLFPNIENQEGVKQIFVFQDTVPEKIWKTVEQDNFYGQTYQMSCSRYPSIPSNYKLLDWKILDHYEKK